MSSITDDSAVISNSEKKQVTVILFGTNRNLNRTELKKLFAVKRGKLYKTRNQFDMKAEIFDMLFAVRASRPADGQLFNYDSKDSVSHIYVVDVGVCIKDFATLKYGSELLGGFDVSKSEMDEIQILLESYRAVASFCIRGKNSLNGLQLQTETIADSHLIISSKFQELLSKSLQELNDMTYPVISFAKDKVDEWFEMHFWKDVYSTNNAEGGKSIQFAALDVAS
jgi:hypothetical protein